MCGSQKENNKEKCRRHDGALRNEIVATRATKRQSFLN